MVPLGNNGWAIHPLDTPPPAFGSFERVVAQWHEKRREAIVPRWIDYAITDFAGWYGQFCLCRLISDPRDVKYELFGTTVAEWVGRDLTGKTLRNTRLALHEDYLRLYIEHYDRVATQPGIGHRQISLSFIDRAHIRGEALDLPIGKATHKPTHVLTFLRRYQTASA